MIQKFRPYLTIHQKRELWYLVLELRGDMAKVAEKLKKKKEIVELEYLELFIECLLKVNHHLGVDENRYFIEKLTEDQVIRIIEQASKNSYYTSIKNLNMLLSMMQCTLQEQDNLARDLDELERVTTKFECLLYEIKALFWDQIDQELDQKKPIIVKNESSTQGTFQDLYIKLDLDDEEQKPKRKQHLITDKDFLDQLNKIMAERQIPYWDQVVLRWNLMQQVFNNQ